MTDVISITNPVTNQVTVVEQESAVVTVVTEGPQGAPYASAAAQAATEAARDQAVAAATDANAAKTDILNRISYGYSDPVGGSTGDIYFKIV